MVNQYSNEMTRIRIQRLITNNSNINISNRWNTQFMVQILRERLGAIPHYALEVSYRTDPFNVNESNHFTRYGFVDCTFRNIENLPVSDAEIMLALFRGEHVNIMISPNESWNLYLQNRNINLLRNSTNSITSYIINQEEYNRRGSNIIFEPNPFTANEEEPSLGYRDAYTDIVITSRY